jgi:hypothetical protein
VHDSWRREPRISELSHWHGTCLWLAQEAAVDLLFVLVVIGFFAIAWAYTVACDRI